MKGIDKLIINSAYQEPTHHWAFDEEQNTFVRKPYRRPAGYFIAGQGSNAYNDIGKFMELQLVNLIRPRVKAWRKSNYPCVTSVTRTLLEHWHDPEARAYPFFFCELDAIETLIWLIEAPAVDKVGVEIPSDGGLFTRICTKLCTGGGKTSVMGMLIAYMVCNKVSYPQDKRFSKNILVIAPNLTVKSRLQVLDLGGDKNYYNEFSMVPVGLMDKLHQGKVMIINWQALEWESEEQIAKRKSVDKRGVMSDVAYVRSVLGEMAKVHNILVINDEAHHAWRRNPETKVKKELKAEAAQATIWISGLDRIHRVCGIQTCYDFSATPFAPTGRKNDEETLFDWIVSDFGLNDGIEAGLVKTPQFVVRDDVGPDTKTLKSKLYHIYADVTVKDDVNRSATAEEPLPDLLIQGYTLLGKDWERVAKEWERAGSNVPPVMITVANRTETAARVEYTFARHKIEVPGLCEEDKILRIDSKVMEEADSSSGTKKEAALALRERADTIGKYGKSGGQIRNVISVGMLSEGWDAKTVTNIMGIRAFSSQLLCEQVIGRGLRRVSYDVDEKTGLFEPEYVNIFGIPFTFLPHEENSGAQGKQPKPKTQIEVVPEKEQYAISWPNIIRIDRTYNPKLEIDLTKMKPLTLKAGETRISAEMATIIDGKEEFNTISEIDLEKLYDKYREQTQVFTVTREIYEQLAASWKEEATKYALFGQVIKIVEEYLTSDIIRFDTGKFQPKGIVKTVMRIMNMNQIVKHLWNYIQSSQTEKAVPIYDRNKRVRSTRDMPTWYTTKPCVIAKKCHISHAVCDSTWEDAEAYRLDKLPHVAAWVKNDHLGFEIVYSYSGVIRKYYPDFLIKLTNGMMLVLEVKGQENAQDRAKREALEEWINVVNATGEFGTWTNAVSYNVGDIPEIIEKVYNCDPVERVSLSASAKEEDMQRKAEAISANCTEEEEEMTKQVTKEYVWYACYGSNLSYDRFMKYINKCKDKTPPVKNMWEILAGRIIFSGEKTRNWGEGGTAFWEHNDFGDVIVRLYKITREQYAEVKEQEGGRYQVAVNGLGELEGIPIYSFTGDMDQVEEAVNPPSASYYKCIFDALTKEYGISAKEAKEYIEQWYQKR